MSNQYTEFDLQTLKVEQIEKSNQVIHYDDFEKTTLKFIGGADVGFEENGQVTRAAIVVLKYPELTLIEYQIARVVTQIPYIPGFLSFREIPALLASWKKLYTVPDLLVVDGQGIAHPRRLGVASHLGLLLDTPTIGVAKQRLYGKHPLVPESAGSAVPLSHNNEVIGYAFRSKARCNPLYISIGHRVSSETALNMVKRCMRGYRLPEPTRWADAVASQKSAFTKWLSKANTNVYR